MKLRGIGLPINTVIILTLAILVLVLIVYMIISGTDISPITYQDAFRAGCRVYVETGQSPSTIMLNDVTKDGKEDSLLSVCRLYYAVSDMDDEACAGRCKEVFSFGGGSLTITCPTENNPCIGRIGQSCCSKWNDDKSNCLRVSDTCYCSSETDCIPMKRNGELCTKSYECKSNCCGQIVDGNKCVTSGNCQTEKRP